MNESSRERDVRWSDSEPVVFTRTATGDVLADRFPPLIAITKELEQQATGPVIRRARNYLMFRVANGRARYRLVQRRRDQSLWRREMVAAA
jgi:hypothetical protein